MDITTPTILQIFFAVALAGAFLFAGIAWIRGFRRPAAGPRRPVDAPVVPADEGKRRVDALFAAAAVSGERPTEDDIAQARLGGPRGARELGAAPMVRQQADNTPWPVGGGHVT